MEIRDKTKTIRLTGEDFGEYLEAQKNQEKCEAHKLLEGDNGNALKIFLPDVVEFILKHCTCKDN